MSQTTSSSPIAPPQPEELDAAWLDPALQQQDADRRRRRRRRLLLLAGIPFALLALAVAAVFIGRHLIGAETVRSYEAASYEQSLNSSQRQKILNLYEQWKAPYDTGTSYLQLGLNPEARAELEDALALAAGAQQCPVRANLAIAVERLGDQAQAAGDEAGAQQLYREALQVIEERPAECEGSSSSDPMAQTQQRVTEKLEQSQSEAQGGQQPDDGEPGPTDDGTGGGSEQDDGATGLEQIEEQLGESQQDRQDMLDEDHGQGSGGGTGRPW